LYFARLNWFKREGGALLKFFFVLTTLHDMQYHNNIKLHSKKVNTLSCDRITVRTHVIHKLGVRLYIRFWLPLQDTKILSVLKRYRKSHNIICHFIRLIVEQYILIYYNIVKCEFNHIYMNLDYRYAVDHIGMF